MLIVLIFIFTVLSIRRFKDIAYVLYMQLIETKN